MGVPALLAVCTLLGFTGWLSSQHWAQVVPGPAINLTNGPGQPVWLPTVDLQPMPWTAVPACWLTRECTAVGSASATAGPGTVDQFEASRRSARAAADRVTGTPTALPAPGAQLTNVAGPSGGLALALADLQHRWGPLPHPVAATGTLSDDGVVGPVGAVGVKVRSADSAGATLVVAPPGSAPSTVPGVTVIAVASLTEAVHALCPPPAHSAFCTAAAEAR